jgi:hypothetical protein
LEVGYDGKREIGGINDMVDVIAAMGRLCDRLLYRVDGRVVYRRSYAVMEELVASVAHRRSRRFVVFWCLGVLVLEPQFSQQLGIYIFERLGIDIVLSSRLFGSVWNPVQIFPYHIPIYIIITSLLPVVYLTRRTASRACSWQLPLS